MSGLCHFRMHYDAMLRRGKEGKGVKMGVNFYVLRRFLIEERTRSQTVIST